MLYGNSNVSNVILNYKVTDITVISWVYIFTLIFYYLFLPANRAWTSLIMLEGITGKSIWILFTSLSHWYQLLICKTMHYFSFIRENILKTATQNWNIYVRANLKLNLQDISSKLRNHTASQRWAEKNDLVQTTWLFYNNRPEVILWGSPTLFRLLSKKNCSGKIWFQ